MPEERAAFDPTNLVSVVAEAERVMATAHDALYVLWTLPVTRGPGATAIAVEGHLDGAIRDLFDSYSEIGRMVR